MWFLASISSAIIYSLRSIIEKKTIRHVNKYILAFALRVFALPFFIIPLILNRSLLAGFNEPSSTFWIAVIYMSFISTPLEMLLYYEALKEEEVTFVIPFLAVSPLWTTIFNAFFFKEFPTFLGLLGICSIVFGIYLLKIKKAKEGLLEPFKHLVNNRAVRLMMIMVLFYSWGIVVDKIAIVDANLYLYAFINYLLVSFSLFIIAYLRARKYFIQIKYNYGNFFGLGIIVAGYTLLRLIALEEGNAAYVSTIMSSSILFTILFGIFYLKEKDKFSKMLAGIFIFAGLILIKVLG